MNVRVLLPTGLGESRYGEIQSLINCCSGYHRCGVLGEEKPEEFRKKKDLSRIPSRKALICLWAPRTQCFVPEVPANSQGGHATLLSGSALVRTTRNGERVHKF